jgi:hypothetical protein
MQKRGINGLGWCILCKERIKSIAHLIMSCSYTIQVWKELERMTSIREIWCGTPIEKGLNKWSNNYVF